MDVAVDDGGSNAARNSELSVSNFHLFRQILKRH